MKKLTKKQKLVIEYALSILSDRVEGDIVLGDGTMLTCSELNDIIENIDI